MHTNARENRRQGCIVGLEELYPLWALSTVGAGGLEYSTVQIGKVRHRRFQTFRGRELAVTSINGTVRLEGMPGRLLLCLD